MNQHIQQPGFLEFLPVSLFGYRRILGKSRIDGNGIQPMIMRPMMPAGYQRGEKKRMHNRMHTVHSRGDLIKWRHLMAFFLP